ncbi:hypothetical protein M7I_6503 [Glarea lozoyensis 74030]|uniref:Zn(2)-C6 fungal-type domain-containing protein n=1 Tax=Glarea lozoyensis (strain ATCC 74030 / MF5533) TaxID=1104152 RepID=H0EUR4_GLAL7|nr:hypothetical protein M7I_6503 [Glarea lozoyensis 74030]
MCDESGPPCKACAALEIPCTRNRPSRRRGPPNRHAEAIKKRRFGFDSPTDTGGGGGGFDSPTSPNNVAATLARFSSHAVLNAESICPFETLELLVDDFFTYIHPLCPFPHEPSFRAAFKSRQDLSNPLFLALLASMTGRLWKRQCNLWIASNKKLVEEYSGSWSWESDHIDLQPPGTISKLTGFNIGIKIYLTVSPVATMEMAYGIDEVFDWSRQKRIVEDSSSNPDDVEEIVFREREAIVQDLLQVLGSINQTNMEPNAGSFSGAGLSSVLLLGSLVLIPSSQHRFVTE